MYSFEKTADQTQQKQNTILQCTIDTFIVCLLIRTCVKITAFIKILS